MIGYILDKGYMVKILILSYQLTISLPDKAVERPFKNKPTLHM